MYKVKVRLKNEMERNNPLHSFIWFPDLLSTISENIWFLLQNKKIDIISGAWKSLHMFNHERGVILRQKMYALGEGQCCKKCRNYYSAKSGNLIFNEWFLNFVIKYKVEYSLWGGNISNYIKRKAIFIVWRAMKFPGFRNHFSAQPFFFLSFI